METGSRTSPTPPIRAGLPYRKNGTSAPRSSAHSANVAGGIGLGESALSARRVAAASLLPPPNPPPAGIPLRIVISRARSNPTRPQYKAAALQARLLSFAGAAFGGSHDMEIGAAPTRRGPAQILSISKTRIGTTSESRRWYPSGLIPEMRSPRFTFAPAGTHTRVARVRAHRDVESDTVGRTGVTAIGPC